MTPPPTPEPWHASGGVGGQITRRIAAQRGFYPTRKTSTSWYTILPAVPLSSAVLFCTRVYTGMKPALGHDLSVDVQYARPGTHRLKVELVVRRVEAREVEPATTRNNTRKIVDFCERGCGPLADAKSCHTKMTKLHFQT